MSRPRDPEHDNVTLKNKVTIESYSVELYSLEIRDLKNLQNKKDHRSSATRTNQR